MKGGGPMATPLRRNPVAGDVSYVDKPIRVKSQMSRAFTGGLNAAVLREEESTGSGGLEDPRQRPMAATMDPGDAQ